MVYIAPKKNRQPSRLLLLAIVDFLLTLLCSLLVFWLLFNYSFVELNDSYRTAIFTFSLVVLIFCSAFGLYDADRAVFSWNVFRRLLMAWFVVIATVALLVVVTKTSYSYSRIWFFSTSLLSFLLMLMWRVFIAIRVKKELKNQAKNFSILAVGDLESLENTVARLTQTTEYKYQNIIKVVWSDDDYQCQVDGIEKMLEKNVISQVWVIGGSMHNEHIEGLLRFFGNGLARLNYYPDLSFLPGPSTDVISVSGLAEVSLTVNPLRYLDQWLKNLFDRFFAIVILVFLSPIMLLIAIGVKLSSPGPILFKQQRLTKDGRAFEMLKFRSMPVDVESDSGPVWAKSGENRATAFGQFLRSSSLDELPQFFNVLKGDMSVVGPRPERPFFVEKFQNTIPAYMQKHYVKAGITGWAQVNGLRGNTSIEKRIEHDLFYIQHWSFWLDIKIIIMTVFKGFFSKSAY